MVREGRTVNRYSSIPDVSMQRHAAGGGHASLFACMRCGKNKPQQGRKLQRVQGLRTWVCAGCAK